MAPVIAGICSSDTASVFRNHQENIRYGRLDATDEEVENAAMMVGAHDFIRSMEKGYDTEAGEGGSNMSTGQKQLISFARAILADPKIFVLDEATSAIDTESEMKIQAAAEVLLKNRTSFIIAHSSQQSETPTGFL